MSRSSAYWAANRYPNESVEPLPDAPLHDLPAGAAARFRAVREGLRALDGVGETVRFMGATWRWAWEYGIGNRKICWVHIIGNSVSTTFTVGGTEEDRLRKTPRLAAELVRALDEAQRTGPVKWCWLELADKRAVEVFLRFAARKAEWLTERPTKHRAPRLGPRRNS
jgi:Protein of unknown function (DUF3788)